MNAALFPYLFSKVPNRRVNHTAVSVNAGSARAWRAPNHPQVSFVTCSALEDLAAKLQDLYLSGRKQEAQDAVPDELVDAVALVGPREKMREQIAEWKTAPIGTLIVGTTQLEALRTLAELCL